MIGDQLVKTVRPFQRDALEAALKAVCEDQPRVFTFSGEEHPQGGRRWRIEHPAAGGPIVIGPHPIDGFFGEDDKTSLFAARVEGIVYWDSVQAARHLVGELLRRWFPGKSYINADFQVFPGVIEFDEVPSHGKFIAALELLAQELDLRVEGPLMMDGFAVHDGTSAVLSIVRLEETLYLSLPTHHTLLAPVLADELTQRLGGRFKRKEVQGQGDFGSWS